MTAGLVRVLIAGFHQGYDAGLKPRPEADWVMIIEGAIEPEAGIVAEDVRFDLAGVETPLKRSCAIEFAEINRFDHDLDAASTSSTSNSSQAWGSGISDLLSVGRRFAGSTRLDRFA